MKITNIEFISFFKKYKEWILMLLATILPVIIIAVFPKYFHPDDMQEFLRWSKIWDLNWRNIYSECASCAYPFLGTFFSGGIISFIEFEANRHIVRAFHVYLALVDALNIVIIYFILKELKIQNPSLWAGVIGLLPSSWIGTSYWGQIDGIGQFIILTIILATIIFNLKENVNLVKYNLFLIFSGVLLSSLLLTKQLALFSLISLSAMIVFNILLYSRSFANILSSTLILFASFILPIVIVDMFLQIPVSYISHLHYLFAKVSHHGDIISSYGFNIWILFYNDPLSSSRNPLFDNLGVFSKVEISPFSVGIIAFFVSNALLFIPIFRYMYSRYKSQARFFSKEDIFLWLFQLSFLNLSFNIFLTGTHERYLYHFYPFVIIAFLGIPIINRKAIYVLLGGSLFYGAFLYGYLSALNMLVDPFIFYAMAVFHFSLFVYLIITLNKYFLVRQND